MVLSEQVRALVEEKSGELVHRHARAFARMPVATAVGIDGHTKGYFSDSTRRIAMTIGAKYGRVWVRRTRAIREGDRSWVEVGKNWPRPSTGDATGPVGPYGMALKV